MIKVTKDSDLENSRRRYPNEPIYIKRDGYAEIHWPYGKGVERVPLIDDERVDPTSRRK